MILLDKYTHAVTLNNQAVLFWMHIKSSTNQSSGVLLYSEKYSKEHLGIIVRDAGVKWPSPNCKYSVQFNCSQSPSTYFQLNCFWSTKAQPPSESTQYKAEPHGISKLTIPHFAGNSFKTYSDLSAFLNPQSLFYYNQ